MTPLGPRMPWCYRHEGRTKDRFNAHFLHSAAAVTRLGMILEHIPREVQGLFR